MGGRHARVGDELAAAALQLRAHPGRAQRTSFEGRRAPLGSTSGSRMSFGPRYRLLVYVTLALSFLVVVWGGVVRVSGSGLGCPDWPLCHGQFLPGLDTQTRIEWFHRFLGVAGGLSLAALVLITVARYRASRAVFGLAVVAGVLYVFQALLGAAVVLLELPHTWVTA